MTDVIENLREELIKLKARVTKNNNERRQDRRVREDKLKQVREKETQIREAEKIACSEKDRTYIEQIIKRCKETIVDLRLVSENRLSKFDNKMEFDLKPAGNLIPLMDGKDSITLTMLDGIKFYSDMLKPESKPVLFKSISEMQTAR